MSGRDDCVGGNPHEIKAACAAETNIWCRGAGPTICRATLCQDSAGVSQEITELLLAWNEGDAQALDRLMPLVHSELHQLAHRYMAGERAGHPLQTTALVNEAYLRLIDSSRVRWQNRAHFFAVSAQLMRRILVDVARARQQLKRGGESVRFRWTKPCHSRRNQAPI